MMQDEAWLQKFHDVVAFIKINKRNSSKHDEEKGKCLNWFKNNRKLYASGSLKEDRAELFKALMELSEQY